MAKQLFDNQSTNGNSSAVVSKGGPHKAHIVYNSGSGTVTVQTAAEGGTFVSVGSDGVFTASGQVVFATMPGDHIRLNLAGASGADIDGWVGPVEQHFGEGFEDA